MKNLSRITQLFDIYGLLLPSKQYDYIIDYYFNDLSLSEIAQKYEISRAAIHYSINEGIKDLQNYENKLKFLSLQENRIKLYNKINDKNLRDKLMKLEFNLSKVGQ